MTIADALSIADLRRLAKRRLPRILFDLIESGVEDERSLLRNEAAFQRYRLLPRYLVDIARREQATPLFGRIYASPLGISPTGFAGLLRRGADLMLAKAAVAANIPFVLSGASIASLESIAAAAPDHAWYHLYAARDRAITEDLIRRARDAGFGSLVLTVDNPVYPKRERDTRNGFGGRLKLPIVLEALTHPAWLVEYLRHGGMPRMANWAAYAKPGASGQDIARFFRAQSPSVQTWRDLEGYRRLWTGNLVVKGIQHPDDARRAAKLGVDGIIVSNHGGKAFDPLPAPLDSLPAICAAVGNRLTVMLDGGVRRGADIVIARCLGARFVFVGRATLYGVVAGGYPGALRAIDILREEIDLSLALIGCPDFAGLGPDVLVGDGSWREDDRHPPTGARSAQPSNAERDS